MTGNGHDTSRSSAGTEGEAKKVSKPPSPPLHLDQVLQQEHDALREKSAGAEEVDGTPPPIYRKLHDADLSALCLSGGGIRSAAFALGMLQCFAGAGVKSRRSDPPTSQPLLTQFDYLSSVSGGGYIASWLSAYLMRDSDTLSAVKKLGRRDAEVTQFKELDFLRRNTDYLAPEVGLMSPDLWADSAIYVRNLILNWVLILPALLLGVLLIDGVGWLIEEFATTGRAELLYGGLAAGSVCLLIALSFDTANRPSRAIVNGQEEAFLLCGVLIAVLGAAFLGEVLVNPAISAWLGYPEGGSGWSWRRVILPIGGAVFYFMAWWCAFVWGTKRVERHFGGRLPPAAQPARDYQKYSRKDQRATAGAGLAFGISVSFGLWLFQRYATFAYPQAESIARILCPAPWILLCINVSQVCLVAFSNRWPNTEVDREWSARAGGWRAAAQILWLILGGLTLLVPYLLYLLSTGEISLGWLIGGTGGVGGLSALGGVLLGGSKATQFLGQLLKAGRRFLSLDTLAALLALVGGAVLIVMLSIALDAVLWPDRFDPIAGVSYKDSLGDFGWYAGALLVLVGVVWTATKMININRFSLHSLYRNRLVKTFLGADNLGETKRRNTENNFTHFDELDNPDMYLLWPKVKDGQWRPFHVINVTLNLVKAQNLAWQQRKAASFTMSPLHCGSGSSALADEGAYRSTREYGGDPDGISLGTAMAISGAAASPSMGYHTSSGLALLMTMFNVRLGWWLGNPARWEWAVYHAAGPASALAPLAQEALGLTSGDKSFLYLSDGGHFENLGLYEMVRRRCRVIVISDAGCDPEYKFEDLSNALRKIYIDLGIQIRMYGLEALTPRPEKLAPLAGCARYWAVGEILYSQADGVQGDGLLLYIKAGVHGSESADVLGYALDNPEFPHDTTANQFFDEAQFESYRALGNEIAWKALARAVPLPGKNPAPGKCFGLDEQALENVDLRELVQALLQAIREEPIAATCKSCEAATGCCCCC